MRAIYSVLILNLVFSFSFANQCKSIFSSKREIYPKFQSYDLDIDKFSVKDRDQGINFLLAETAGEDTYGNSLNYLSYQFNLHKNFRNSLDRLGSHSLWLDASDSNFAPVDEYISARRKNSAKVIAITEAIPKNLFSWYRLLSMRKLNKFFPIIGKPVKRIDEVRSSSLDLITDLYGPMTSAEDISLTLMKYLDWLKIGGKAYITIRNRTTVLIPEKVEKRKWIVFGSMVEKERYRTVNFADYIKYHLEKSGVAKVDFADHGRPIDAKIRIEITKTGSDVSFPKLELSYRDRFLPMVFGPRESVTNSRYISVDEPLN